MKIRPVSDFIVIKPEKDPDESIGGLVIPESAKDNKLTAVGTVVSMGTGRHENGLLIPHEVAVGDVVMYWKAGPVGIMIENKPHLIARSNAIVGVIEVLDVKAN